MENPCDNCLIKVNCTTICFEKRNYKTLLNNAVIQSRSCLGVYHKYSTMLSNTMTDEFNIEQRAREALNH